MLKKGGRAWWCSCLVMIPILLVMCCWVSCVTSNRALLGSLAPALPPHNHASELSSNQVVEEQEGGEEEEVSTSSRLGSRPPSCRYRCKGCVPCEAIQIPTKTNPVGLLYANYEPEGWRCKCGASFYNP